MLKRAKENPKIKFIMDSEIKEISGEEKVEKVILHNNKTNTDTEMEIDGIFVAIGHIPNSKVFEGIDRDPRGFITVQNHYRTNVEGVFVAGDVHDAEYKQAITAAGFGCAAALEAEKWLRDMPDLA
jgi:thioredoxin reductase (NADPH)